MAKVHAYLNFNGDCEQAFKFYETVFETQNIGMHKMGDIRSRIVIARPQERKARQPRNHNDHEDIGFAQHEVPTSGLRPI